MVNGYAQAEHLDYDETFPPIAQMVTIKIVIVMAAHYKWLIFQMDVKSALLSSDLDEEVYVDQSTSFVVSRAATKVCRVKNALDGMKQAPKA